MEKYRLDQLLVERGLATSRAQAQRLVMAGQVRVDGQVALKPAVKVALNAQVEVDKGPRFVSRGGEKLEAALQAFGLQVNEKICADVGASTGGFTDCLLQYGARKVYAIDVGKGILDWRLRQNPQVVVMENTNARFVERLPEAIELVTIDASFISLKVLLPVVRGWLAEAGGEIISLVKPQFEAGRAEVRRGKGVIRDPAVHRWVLQEVLEFAQREGFGLRGLVGSPMLGPKGNIEFLAWLEYPAKESQPIESITDVVLGQG